MYDRSIKFQDEEDLVYLEGYMYDENICNHIFKDEETPWTFCIISNSGRKLFSKKVHESSQAHTRTLFPKYIRIACILVKLRARV